MARRGDGGVSQATALPGTDRWWFGLERKWWVLMSIGVGTFLAAMDSSVVTMTLPLIQRSFGASLSNMQWVVMAHLLTIASLLLTFGRLGDMLGHKRVYNVGFIIMIVAATLSSMAQNEWWLMASRALQGLGGAVIMSNSPAILTSAFPTNQRGQALGMQGTMTYLGLTVGPSLGGYVADNLGWRWAFFIDVPIGIIATMLAFLVIPSLNLPRKREKFDPAGALTMAAGLALLLLALSKGPEWGWGSPTTLAPVVAGVVLLGAFVWIERVVRFPMVDLALFQNRLFAAATSSALINYICAYSVTFLMPFYLVQGRGYSPSFAGLLLTAMSLTMATVAPLSGSFSDRVGSRLPSTAGMAITAAGLLALSLIGPDTSVVDMVWRLMLAGAGLGIFASPNNSAILGSVPPQRRGIASGVVALARTTGMVLGVGIIGALFSSGLARWMPVAPQLAFFEAFREAFFAIAGLALIGTVISLVRGPQLVARSVHDAPTTP